MVQSEWFSPHPAVLDALNRCCTAHGLYALVAKLVPWEAEGGPEEWEKLKKGRPLSSGAWSLKQTAGLDGTPTAGA